MAKNETSAAAGCKAYCEAQEVYRRTDYDQDGILEYAQCIRGGRKTQDWAPLDLEKLPKPSAEEQQQLATLIRSMGADDFSDRERAFKELNAFGAKAYGALLNAAKTEKDAEIASRCKKLVEEISEAMNPKPKHDVLFGLFIAGDNQIALVTKEIADAECPRGADLSKAKPKDGYHYRPLHKQGKGAPGGVRSYIVTNRHASMPNQKENQTLGYALLVFPQEYGKTGKRCFIINNNGTIYEKDFGDKDKTEAFARACEEFDPEGWKVAD